MSDNKLKKEFKYKLEVPIIVQSAGENLHINEITLKAPNQLQMVERIVLKQALMSAIQAQVDKENAGKSKAQKEADAREAEEKAKQAKEQPAGETDGAGMMMVLYASKSPKEIQDVFNAFIDILCNGGAMMNNQSLTKHNIDEIDPDDLEGMLGDYFANFTLRSAMKQAKKN